MLVLRVTLYEADNVMLLPVASASVFRVTLDEASVVGVSPLIPYLLLLFPPADRIPFQNVGLNIPSSQQVSALIQPGGLRGCRVRKQ